MHTVGVVTGPAFVCVMLDAKLRPQCHCKRALPVLIYYCVLLV